MSSHARSQTHISHLFSCPPLFSTRFTRQRQRDARQGRSALTTAPPPPPRRSALRIEDDLMSTRLFELLDSDGSNEITFQELSAALATFGSSELDRARFAFCLYDLDGSGRGLHSLTSELNLSRF